MEKVRKLKEMARNSIGARDYPTYHFQFIIRLMLHHQKLVDGIIETMKEELKKSPYFRLLGLYGYNTVSLAQIVGEVGDIRRFPNHKKFIKYIGLDIAEARSGSSIHKRSYITKKGNKILRGLFYNMVLVHLAYKRPPIYDFFDRLKANGKHAKQCMVACARKLAVMTYYEMLKCHEVVKNESNSI